MKKALLAVFSTLVAVYLSFMLDAAIGIPGIETITAIAVMGGFIIYFNETKK